MPWDSLGDFLTVLQDAREVVRIAAPVDPNLELNAISEHVLQTARGTAPVLWFDSVRNSNWPVVCNVLGSPQRAIQSLRLNQQLDQNLSAWLPEDLTFLAPAAASSDASRRTFPSKAVRQAPCQQVVKLGKEVSLWDLPAIRSWPLETYPGFTAGVIVTPDLTTGEATLSRAPLLVLDRQRLLPYWPGDAGPRRWARMAQQQSRQVPIAIAFGSDPALALLTDLTSWHGGPVTFSWWNQVRRSGLNVVKCRSHDLEVPADAEVIIEGFIDPDVPWEPVGTLALSTGHYAAETVVPSIQVTAITHRANPIFPVELPSAGASEASVRRALVDRCFVPVLQRLAPAIQDFARPVGGQGRSVFVSVRKQFALEAHTVAHAIWSSPGLRCAKLVVVVDADVTIHEESAVWRAVEQNCDPQRDFHTQTGPADLDDHAMGLRGMGGRVLIDATRKTAQEGFLRPWPEALTFPQEILQNLTTRLQELGLSRNKGPGS